MGGFVHSRPIPVSDEDMSRLEWLHEEVRNEYEHFVPKFYLASADDLLRAAETCLCVTHEILFSSNNVLFHEMPGEQLKNILQSVLQRLRAKK